MTRSVFHSVTGVPTEQTLKQSVGTTSNLLHFVEITLSGQIKLVQRMGSDVRDGGQGSVIMDKVVKIKVIRYRNNICCVFSNYFNL